MLKVWTSVPFSHFFNDAEKFAFRKEKSHQLFKETIPAYYKMYQEIGRLFVLRTFKSINKSLFAT